MHQSDSSVTSNYAAASFFPFRKLNYGNIIKYTVLGFQVKRFVLITKQ